MLLRHHDAPVNWLNLEKCSEAYQHFRLFLKNMYCRFRGGKIAIERANFCQRCGKGRIAVFYLDYSCCCFKKVIELRLTPDFCRVLVPAPASD